MNIDAKASKPVLSYEDFNGLNIQRVSDDALPLGTLVSLASTGKVVRSTATAVPLGVVVVSPNRAGAEVTVQTNAHAVVDATASGNLAPGALVSQTSATGTLPTFAATSNGQYVHGIVLYGANSGGTISVAIIHPFRNTAAA